jgi:hypothetical protein
MQGIFALSDFDSADTGAHLKKNAMSQDPDRFDRLSQLDRG